MTTQIKSSKTLHVSLWIAQLLVCILLLWVGFMKLTSPISGVTAMMPWAAEYPGLLRFTGFCEIVGGIGLVLPSLLRIQPQLTPLAAVAITVMALAGAVFHVMRNEASVTGVNIIVVLLTVFIAWGRFRKIPVRQR